MKKMLTTLVMLVLVLTAGAANEVKETTTWTFDEIAANMKIGDVRDINGLYIRGQQGHEATVIASKVKGNLTDGTRSKTYDSGRNITLFFNGEVVKQLNAQKVADSNDNLAVIEYDAPKGGTFFLGGSAEIILCYARFVAAQ